MDQLESLSNRGYTEGFYRRHVPKAFQNYETGHSSSSKHQFVGEVSTHNPDNSLSIEVKNKFSVGDTLELMTPNGNIEFKLEQMTQERNQSPLDVAPGSGHHVRIPLPDNASNRVIEKGLILRRLD